VLELVHRLGVANLVAAMIGLITLCIARSLDKSDTLHVLAAVLDTQFWLSTHVVTVTAGYAVTYLAGFFGAVALVRMALKRSSTTDGDNLNRQLYRMAYFSVCFGILFSFVGTVLGGLWADDSWGRFWGWDPKENGALMIVLWNALVLHARWDKMVGLRGFAVLALLGNIVTSWSWFGTNLLGIGLHNYGFNKSVAYALVATLVIHLALIIGALLLTSSDRRASVET
jgi:ABC-type transport system involved in cytochrome c biogenesis permease subunit